MVGRTVGRYRIIAKLGQGGMGSVWKAEDTLLGRTIALKFLPQELADSPEARQRFLREARTASILDHPGIATVHDAGEADGHVYIALQHIDGETVGDRLAQGPLAIHDAVRIAVAAGEALGHAHERGILHRDISAQNLMLARDGRVVVVDFGLALPEGHTRLTQTGARMGTVAYMAPEIASGGKADRASDVYSLGVVLYEMLTGELPFAGERPEALLYAALHEKPKPPSAWCKDVPPELDRIVLRALAKAPNERYPSAHEVTSALREFDRGWSARDTPKGNAVTTPVAPAKQRPARFWSRPSLLIAYSSVLLAFAAVATIVLFVQRRPHAPRSTSVAVLPLRNLSGDPESTSPLADGIAENLSTMLTHVAGLQVTPWMTSQRYSPLTNSFEDIAKEVGVDVLVAGSLRASANALQVTISLVDGETGFQRWADSFDSPRADLFTVQREIVNRVAKALRGRLTGEEERALARPAAENVDAYEFYLRGRHALQGDDLAAYGLALDLFQKALELDPNLADAYVGVGAMLTARYYKSWGGGSKNLDEAETNFRKALDLDPASTAARRGLIRVYFNQGRDEECLKVGEEARRLGVEDVDHLLVRADAYHYGALYEKAAPLYERVLKLDPANEAAQAYVVFNEYSLRHFQEALDAGEMFVSRFGDNIDVLGFMVGANTCLGRLDQCKGIVQRMVDLEGETRGGGFMAELSLTLRMGKTDEALQLLLQAIEEAKHRLALYPDDPHTRVVLAGFYGQLGDRLGLQREERVLMAGNAGGNIIAGLGDAHAALGDWRGAMDLYRTAIRMGHRYQVPYEASFQCDSLRAAKFAQAPGYAEMQSEYKELGERLSATY